MNTETLQNFLAAHIPAMNALGIRVAEAAPQQVILAAPLAPNINHHHTMFGGSLSLLATLCGWAMAHTLFPECGGRIVIADSQMRYLRPTDSSARAICALDAGEAAQLAEAKIRLQQKGRAALRLRCRIECGGQETVRFEGRFVLTAAQDGSEKAA